MSESTAEDRIKASYGHPSGTSFALRLPSLSQTLKPPVTQSSPDPVDVLAERAHEDISGTAVDDTHWSTGEPLGGETATHETVHPPNPAEKTEAAASESRKAPPQLSTSAPVRANVSKLSEFSENSGSDQVHTTRVPAAPPGVSPFKKTVAGIGIPHDRGETKTTSRAVTEPKQVAQDDSNDRASVRSASPNSRDAKDRSAPDHAVHDDTRESSSQSDNETARFVGELAPQSASRVPERGDDADKRGSDRPGHGRLSNLSNPSNANKDWSPRPETRALSSERARLASSPSVGSRGKRRWALRLALVALLVVAVTDTIAAFVLVVWSDSPTISPQVIVDDHGNDVLLLTCESCADDTVLSIDQDQARVHDKIARLVLSRPLSVGQNLLQVRLSHVPSGRNESVPLRIPVAFRVRPSLEGLDNPKPTIRIEVQTTPKTRVEVDNQPVPIASVAAEQGLGRFDWDITHLCTGPTSAVTTIEKSFEYAIYPRTGDVVRGSVPVKVTVVPLVIHSPPAAIEVETDSFQLAGWTLPGARVSVENAVIGLSQDGNFTQRLRLLRMGPTTIHIRAQQPGHAPRTVSFTVRRVPELRQAARAWETEDLVQPSGLFKDASSYRGKKVILDGQVTDVASRLSHKFITLTVAGVAKVCAPKACLARVEYGGELAVQKGDKIRGFAYVDEGSTQNAATKNEGDPANTDGVVKVRAAFVLPAAMASSGN